MVAAKGDGEEQRPRWWHLVREEGQQRWRDRQRWLWQKHNRDRGKKDNKTSISAAIAKQEGSAARVQRSVAVPGKKATEERVMAAGATVAVDVGQGRRQRRQ
ncbi:hypothetical protein BHE74_00032066 [Ensete ventricosum]|nr:hypothetical protein GW17_00037696 [Ensete ventricosum]RWW60904.1 hypothetical protein BHE74_00032066 [Ensete ventricosum]RZS05173.1 hypothetical protein BHM03_00035644 [Ensete ventricosum]